MLQAVTKYFRKRISLSAHRLFQRKGRMLPISGFTIMNNASYSLQHDDQKWIILRRLACGSLRAKKTREC